MKPSETIRKWNKQEIVMLLCFMIGGFCIISFFYSVLSEVDRFGFADRTGNFSRFQFNESGIPGPIEMRVANPNYLITLIAGIMLIIAGLTIYMITKEREAKSTKKSLTDALLTPDERAVMELIEKRGGETTQKEITAITGFSKVKVHRIIKSLEERNLVIGRKYGQTRKIFLNEKT